MKIAAISDIHGNLLALQAVLAEIDRLDIDCIINCGDTLGGPLESAKTADLLMARGIPMIAGNHERQVLTLPFEKLNASDRCTRSEMNLSHENWLASAPPTLWSSDEVFVCHGTPSSDLDYWLETVTPNLALRGDPGVRAATKEEILQRLGQGEQTKASLILCGHTHLPRVVQIALSEQKNITVVNPGSVGLPAYSDEHPHPHCIETGSPHARFALIERSDAGWKVQLRSVAYDFEPMARLAEARGRLDWAKALRTGYL